MASTYKTSYYVKLRQTKFAWITVAMLTRITKEKLLTLSKKEPKEIRFNNAWDSTVRGRSGTVENEIDLKEVAVTWPIIQTVTLF